MKKIYTLVGVAICAASMMLTGCQQTSKTEIQRVVSDSVALNIAYINVDSLLLEYDFAKDLREEFVKKAEDARANFNGQMQKFEREAADFQRKLQTNAFLSEDRARQEADRLQKRQNELEQLNQKLQQDLAQQQDVMNQRLNDTVRTFLRQYNAVKRYELILSNTMYDNILIESPKYDITADVLAGLNERYAQTKDKK